MNTLLDSCCSVNLQARFFWLPRTFTMFTSELSLRASLVIDAGNRILNYERFLLSYYSIQTRNNERLSKRDAKETESS